MNRQKRREAEHVRKPERILGSRADVLASTLLQFSTAGAAQDKAHEVSVQLNPISLEDFADV